MPNVTRITSNGTFYTANTIDEISYNLVGTRKNLLRNSQDFNRGLWSPYCGNTNLVTYNTPDIESPDGTFTSTKVVRDSTNVCGSVTPAWGFVYGATNIFTYGKTYTVSVWARTNTGTLLFNLGGNDYLSVYSLTATTAWQRFTYTFVAVPNPTQGDRGIQFFTGVPNSTIYFWGAQLEEGPVATDYVRTDNSGVPISNFVFRTTQTGNYYAKSYIDEVSQNRNAINKNLLTWSQDFTQSDWSKVNGFMQTGFLAPNGTPTAQKFTESTGTIYRQFYRGFSSALYNQVYTISCYYKPAGRFRFNMGYGNQAGLGPDRTVQVNLNTNTITTSDPTIIDRGIIPVNDGWYRVYATFRTPGSGFMTVGTIVGLLDSDGQFVFNGDGISGILMWGAQLELETLSDYVQTGSSTVPVTNFVKRDTANGVSMVTSQFDEKNGVLDQVIDSSLVINLDAAKLESYPGSGTTWFDTTPNRNDMTIYNFGTANSPIVWDYSSQSFLALGNNFGTSIQGIANATINTPSFSIEIWSRVRSFNAGDFNYNMISGRGNFLLHGHRMGYNPAGGSAAATTGTVGFYSVFNGGTISLTSSTISINTWYQTVITFDDTRKFASFYVNGVLVASQRDAVYTMPQQPAWTSGPSAFTNGQGTASINGNIGNFMYYNRPLVASEVLQNYSAIRGRYGI
jgi:hypothetical protein